VPPTDCDHVRPGLTAITAAARSNADTISFRFIKSILLVFI
jgi:hypothetical protein